MNKLKFGLLSVGILVLLLPSTGMAKDGMRESDLLEKLIPTYELRHGNDSEEDKKNHDSGKIELRKEKLGNKLADKMLKLEAQKAKREARCNLLIDKAKTYNVLDTNSAELTEFSSLIDQLGSETLTSEATKEVCHKLEDQFKKLVKTQIREKYTSGVIPFLDTDDSEWYTEYISAVKERKINGKAIFEGFKDSNGNPTGEFGPGNNFKLGELLKVALTIAGHDENEDDASLDDNEFVKKYANHWAKKYIKKAIKLELSLLKDKNQNPENNVTRGQVFQTVAESLGLLKSDSGASCDLSTITYSDFSATHENAKATCVLTKLGVISGTADGKILLDTPVNRAEMAKIVKNILTNYVDKTTTAG